MNHRYLELKEEIMILEFILDYINIHIDKNKIYKKSVADRVEQKIAEKYIEFNKEQVNFYDSFADVRDIALGDVVEYKVK